MRTKYNLFDSRRPPSEEDVRVLKEFLFSEMVHDELRLHKLLENHPALIGVLGFSEFASEYPLYKRDSDNRVILSDKRIRDRADFVAAKDSSVLTASGKPYRSAHIIELKSAAAPISLRDHGTRFSDEVSYAVGQLRDYKAWLTTVPQNRELLSTFGWDIRVPMLYLIAGSDSEFKGNPGLLEAIRGQLQEQGVFLYTANDVLRNAERQASERRVVTDVARWFFATQLTPTYPSSMIIAEVEEVAPWNTTAVRFQRFFEGQLPHPLTTKSNFSLRKKGLLWNLRLLQDTRSISRRPRELQH